MNSYNNTTIIGFDLDQTLYPKSPEIDEAIQQYIYERIVEHTGDDLETAAENFRAMYAEIGSGSKTLEAMGIPNDNDIVQMALERADISKFLAPNQNILDILTRVKDQYGHVDLITGSDDQIARDKLEKMQIPADMFDVFITGDMFSKSNGDAYQYWMQQYPDAKPEQFLYIGDRKGDYLVPDELGMQAIMVNIAEPNIQLDCLQLVDVLDLGPYIID